MDKNKQYICDFILAAISDVSGTIVATDAKAGITFALYSLVILTLVEARGSICGLIQPFCLNKLCLGNSYVVLTMIIAFAFFGISVCYLLLTLIPMKSVKAVDAGALTDVQRKLWMVDLDKNGKLQITLDDYYNNIIGASEDDIIRLEGFELLKLNSIRAMKTNRYKLSFIYLIFFLISVLVLSLIIVIKNL
jgi:hypothetical protein